MIINVVIEIKTEDAAFIYSLIIKWVFFYLGVVLYLLSVKQHDVIIHAWLFRLTTSVKRQKKVESMGRWKWVWDSRHFLLLLLLCAAKTKRKKKYWKHCFMKTKLATMLLLIPYFVKYFRFCGNPTAGTKFIR